MRPKYFLFDIVGAVLLLIGIMLFIKTDHESVTVIIAAFGLLLILIGEYFKGQKEDNNTKLEDKHYETLISIYKYTGGIIVLLIGIAAWIIGGNINETKDSATKEIDNLKNDLKEIRVESLQAMKDLRLDADRQLENNSKNIEVFLALTKDITSVQIETIREDAKNLALSSARTRIEEVFKSSNIQSEIDVALKKEIGDNLGLIVQNEMEDLPIITQLGVTMSFFGDDDRTALDKLDSISNLSKNITSRKLAEKHLYLKGMEFEKGIDKDLMSKFRNSIFNQDSIVTREDSIRVKRELIKSIFNENSAWKVSYAFVILRQFSGKHLNNFDFNAVRRMESELKK